MKQKKLFKVSLPSQVSGSEQAYKVTLPKYSRYITNICNKLFFEYIIDDDIDKESIESTELIITIKKFKKDELEIEIPASFSYLCSYYNEFDKEHLFVYFQDTMSSIVGNFMGMFGGSYKNFF